MCLVLLFISLTHTRARVRYSMIALHPFSTSREAVLQVWSASAQSRRQAPDASLTELFVLLHGMIFTNIQLDDFKGVLARFEEKLMIEGE